MNDGGSISLAHDNSAPTCQARDRRRIGVLAMSRPGYGGTYQYTLSMIQALLRVPHYACTIYTTVGNDGYDGLNVGIVTLPRALAALSSIGLNMLHPTTRADPFSAVDVVIAPIYSSYLLATRRPFVFTLHDLQERYFPQYFSFAQRRWRSFINTALSRTAAGILCESENVKADIHRFLAVDDSRIHVIPSPPVSTLHRLSELESVAVERRSSVPLPHRFIFYPAQFFKHKNHLRLLEAFRIVLEEHPDCYLILTGQPKYEYRRVMAHIETLRLEGRVIHVGYVETDLLSLLYLRTEALVVPTLFESLSIPVYEAFRLGTPVCASNVTALPEQVGDAGLLFDPFSVTEMASAISLLLRDPSLKATLRQRGFERIAAMTLDSYAERLAVLIDRIAAERKT